MTFYAYDVALELNAEIRPIVEQLTSRNGSLADQLKRAASSIALNVAEGNGRSGKDRLHHFRIARGSAAEVLAAIDVAAIWGEIDAERAQKAKALLKRELALLRGLTR